MSENTAAGIAGRKRGAKQGDLISEREVEWVVVALGSNQGDSATLLRKAMNRIEGLAGQPLLRSSLWRTVPVDCPPGSADFLNAVVAWMKPTGPAPGAIRSGVRPGGKRGLAGSRKAAADPEAPGAAGDIEDPGAARIGAPPGEAGASRSEGVASLSCPSASSRPQSPESLLAALQAIEREFGRCPKQVHNEARPLDLDLVAHGVERRQTDQLTLPHPRAAERAFVLYPLVEILPDLVLPGQARTVRELRDGLGEAGSRMTARAQG